MNGPMSSIDNHTCRLCDQSTVRPFLDLGSMPIANAFLSSEQLSEPEYTFNLYFVVISTFTNSLITFYIVLLNLEF